MNINLKRKWLLPGLLTLFAAPLVRAQTGSMLAENSIRTTATSDTTYSYTESLYIGPDAVWTINGTHIIYSKNIWIAPTAQLNGTGTIIIENPATNPFYPGTPASATTIDANNGNAINVTISHRNPNNLVLGDIADPGYGTVNPSGALAASLKLAGNLNLDINGGDILLNGNDLVLQDNAALNNYGLNRMVVTGNSIAGHLVWTRTTAATEVKVFPIGIAEADYSPATIESMSTGSYHVSVTNYAASGATVTNPSEGMNRAWHIYGSPASMLYLQHAAGLNGTAFVDADAFISRYLGSGQWSSGTPEQNSAGLHSSGSIAANIPASAAAAGAWLSKTSDAQSPLPVTLLSFEANKKDRTAILEWATTREQQNMGFEIEHSTDSRSWNKIGFVGSLAENGNSLQLLAYSFTDLNPVNGKNNYRLKQVDREGKYVYSEVRSLWFDATGTVLVYPNPAQDKVTISGLEGSEQVSLYDVSGRLLQEQKADLHLTHISLSGLSEGVYYIRIMDAGGNTASYKIVKGQ